MSCSPREACWKRTPRRVASIESRAQVDAPHGAARPECGGGDEHRRRPPLCYSSTTAGPARQAFRCPALAPPAPPAPAQRSPVGRNSAARVQSAPVALDFIVRPASGLCPVRVRCRFSLCVDAPPPTTNRGLGKTISDGVQMIVFLVPQKAVARDSRWKARLLPDANRIICAPGAHAGCGPDRGAKTEFYGQRRGYAVKNDKNGPPPPPPCAPPGD
eukprot:gene11304-biopygen6356